LFGNFRGLQSEQEVLLTHGDSIDRVASNLKIIAKSGDLVAGKIMPILVNANYYSVLRILISQCVTHSLSDKCCCFLLFTGIEDESRKLFGVQFHPEVDLTENGVTMLKNFLYGVSANCLVQIK